jgi:2-deoxy-D-gluconate 3-dehydrogenase
VADDRSTPCAFTVHGRLAMVTGAGTGIGRGIALGLAAAGADLVLLSDQDNLDPVAEEASAAGAKVTTAQLDLADPGSRRVEIDRLLDQHNVDILVNNAGRIRRAAATSSPTTTGTTSSR